MLSDKTLTLNELLIIFEDIASIHNMINDYGNGPSYNIGASRPLQHPYMWVEPTTSNIVKGLNGFKEMTYSFNIYIMDKINKGDNNYNEILSDTNYIASTVIQLLSQHPNYVEYNLSLSEDVTLEPAQEVTDDNCNGWIISATFKVPIKYTYCSSPIDSLPPPPFVPRYVYVIDDGTTYQLLPGETYSCTLAPVCDPVEITDGDGATYSIPAGGSFSCLPQLIQVENTYAFFPFDSNVIFYRAGFDGALLSEGINNNIATYSIYKNGNLETLPIYFSKDDRFYIQVQRSTSNSQPATLYLNTLGLATPLTYTSKSYYYPLRMIHVEGVTNSVTSMLETDQAIKGTGQVASFFTNCVWSNPVGPAFNVVNPPTHWNFTGQHCWGLNDLSGSYNTVPRYNRMNYCIFFNANDVRIYEKGVLVTTITLAYNQMYHWKITSKFNAGGFYNISYFYSNNDESTYTLLYASTATHSTTSTFNLDWMTQQGYYLEHHVPKIY